MTVIASPIGMVGLGNMGAAMGANLVLGGLGVIASDPDPARRATAAADGITCVGSTAAVARDAQVVITSLPSSQVAELVLKEILESAPAPRIVVETSTLSLEDKERLQRLCEGSEHRLLDCPLSGTSAQARARDLTVLASGDAEAIAAVAEVLERVGRVRNVGAFGAGTRVKLIANLLVAIHNVSTAECLALGMRAGLDLDLLVDVLGNGAGASRMLQVRGPVMASRAYQPAAMTLDLWEKDLGLIAAFARSCASPTPMFDTAQALYAKTREERQGADDTAAVFEQFIAQIDDTDEGSQ